ncbi:competence/damage-inducible protein A [soil metagenome]
MKAEILTIGDELCRGEIVNTNASTLAQRLWDLDITTRWMTSCCDDPDDITSALRQAVDRADVVICSGGLGPTEDDLTVDVVSALVGVAPVVDETSRARMEFFFTRMPTPASTASQAGLAAIQLRQVRVPAGARVLGNPAGLAPCFEQVISNHQGSGVPVFCLPGFPREIAGIWDHALRARLADLREAAGSVERIARQIYRAFGRGESQISQLCRGVVEGVPGATIHYQVKFPETLVKLVVRDRDQAAADARLAAMEAQVRERLAGVLYGAGDDNLVAVVTKQLIETKRTVATAESCTGGMIGELLTSLPGSSAAFIGGAITYSNREKIRQLGVRQATLDAYGAVSEETVREMATGARDRFATDLAVAVSGVAGPDGGTPDKPVGTVWLAIATRDHLETKPLAWPGTREQIRQLSAWWALRLILEEVQSWRTHG